MHKTRHFALLLALFCSLAGLALPAHAYLDPSTGSMILSAIVGLFATIGLAVKTYWYKLKNLLTGRSAGRGQSPPAPAAGQSSTAGDAASGGKPQNTGASRSSR